MDLSRVCREILDLYTQQVDRANVENVPPHTPRPMEEDVSVSTSSTETERYIMERRFNDAPSPLNAWKSEMGRFQRGAVSPNGRWLACIHENHFCVCSTCDGRVFFYSDNEIEWSEGISWSFNSKRVICSNPLIQFLFDMDEKRLYTFHRAITGEYHDVIPNQPAQRRFYIVGENHRLACEGQRDALCRTNNMENPLNEDDIAFEKRIRREDMCVLLFDVLLKKIHLIPVFNAFVRPDGYNVYSMLQTAHVLSPDDSQLFFLSGYNGVRRRFNENLNERLFYKTSEFQYSRFLEHDIDFWDRFNVQAISWSNRVIAYTYHEFGERSRTIVTNMIGGLTFTDIATYASFSPDGSLFFAKTESGHYVVSPTDKISVERFRDVLNFPHYNLDVTELGIVSFNDLPDFQVHVDFLGWSPMGDLVFAATGQKQYLEVHNHKSTNEWTGENVDSKVFLTELYMIRRIEESRYRTFVLSVTPQPYESVNEFRRAMEEKHTTKAVLADTGHVIFTVEGNETFCVREYPVSEMFRGVFLGEWAGPSPLIRISFTPTEMAVFSRRMRRYREEVHPNNYLPDEIWNYQIIPLLPDVFDVTNLTPGLFLYPNEGVASLRVYERWMDVVDEIISDSRYSWKSLYESEFCRRME